MKRHLTFCFIFTLCLTAGSVQAKQIVTIATYDTLPPFAFRDDYGNLTGVYIEIVKQAISNMEDYDVAFRVLPWARAKKEVELGKVFAILPPYFHAHDWLTTSKPYRPYIWPYSLPLITQKDVVICNTTKVPSHSPSYPKDFYGLKFVMWRGDGRAGEGFRELVKNKKVDLILVNQIDSTIPLLLTGKADCTITSKIPFFYYLKNMVKSGQFEKLNKKNIILKDVVTISENEGFLGYTDIQSEQNFPYKKDFSIKFDIEVYNMKRNKEIEKIIKQFVE